MEVIEFIKTFETPIFTIVWTLLWALSWNIFLYYFNIKKEKKDNKIKSFSKIISIKNSWIQYIQTNWEARLLCEFYETRYQLFSKNELDLEEAKKQNIRHLELIKEISFYQKDFFEALWLIYTCFNINLELKTAINDIYNYSSIWIESFPKKFKDIKELDIFFKDANIKLNDLIKKEYKEKIEKLIILLKEQL